MPPFGQFGPQSVAQSAPGANVYELRLRELERRVNELVTARSAERTTIGTGGVLNVDGTENVSGDLNVSGNLNVTGHAAIAGTLSLPDGIIDNDALADPLAADLDNAGNAFAADFTGSFATVETVTLTVPAGFSQAYLVAQGMARASSSGGTVAIEGKIVVAGHTSAIVVSGAGAGGVGVCPVQYGIKLTGLSAGSLNVDLQALSGGFLSGSCGVYLTAFAVFLR